MRGGLAVTPAEGVLMKSWFRHACCVLAFGILSLVPAILASAANPLDEAVSAALASRGAAFAEPCTDEVFVRRLYLDLLGTFPLPKEAEAFLRSKDPDKRAALVDQLFLRKEYADYWSLRWGDILRIKSEFPINLWPNAVQAYHRWVHQALRENMSWDRFARALLTASGSNFRDPPVNFYRAVAARDPASLAKTAALTFLGTRLESWPEEAQADLAAFFSRVAYKRTLEWKEEIVSSNPLAAGELRVRLPHGRTVVVSEAADPRTVFADWLTAPENPWFARALVNRVWYWLLGTGITEPADAIPWGGGGRPADAGAGEGVMRVLEQEFRSSGCDVRSLLSLILTSRTYQQASEMLPKETPAELAFARYSIRRLDAEILADALTWLGGVGPAYSSPIPEPFTYVPDSQPTIALSDGSITSPFLVRFGRPSRDTGLLSERNNQPSEEQALYLLNSTEVRKRIEASPVLRPIYNMPKAQRTEQVRRIYFVLLDRLPRAEELELVAAYAAKTGDGSQAARDLAWALINSKEFLYRH
jgi:hypothetical protein